MFIQGIVQRGKGEAKLLGTPTANVYIKQHLSIGIYAGYLTVENNVYDACIYTSHENNNTKVEAYAINKEGLNLYDKEVSIEIKEFIREFKPFNNFNSLKEQVDKDVKTCIVFHKINSAIKLFSKGHPVIVMDDLDRENEGDIVFPAETITTANITDTLSYSSGIICVTMTEERASVLNLTKMCKVNEDPNGTNFSVSCDHVSTTTGVSAEDRAKTIRELAFSNNKDEFTRPGHIFPLICKNGLLSERKGHTEASVQLCMLSGLKPVAVICELMNSNGTMMRLNDCKRLSYVHDIPLISVKEIEEYSTIMKFESNLESKLHFSECDLYVKDYELPFKLRVYKDLFTNEELPVLIKEGKNNLLRIHSECLTGNVFHSLHCDCEEQLQKSIKTIYQEGGMVMYVGCHEGRGIGLFNKVKAYKLQAEGEDTMTANIKLGFKDDCRDYSFCIRVLKEMGLSEIKLLTNNPKKVSVLKDHFNVTQVTFGSTVTDLNKKYLVTKVKEMSHSHELLNLKKEVNTCSSFNIDKDTVYGKTVYIVFTVWNKKWIQTMVKKIDKKLEEYNIKVGFLSVPGAYELPIACQRLSSEVKDLSAIIAVGVVLKGDTVHFEYICDSVYKGLMDVQIKNDVPIINGVLTCLTEKQVEDRVNSSLPEDWALSALHLIQSLSH